MWCGLNGLIFGKYLKPCWTHSRWSKINRQEPATISSLIPNPAAADEIWSERRRKVGIICQDWKQGVPTWSLIWAEVGRMEEPIFSHFFICLTNMCTVIMCQACVCTHKHHTNCSIFSGLHAFMRICSHSIFILLYKMCHFSMAVFQIFFLNFQQFYHYVS